MDRLVTGGARLALGTAQWGMPYGLANRTGPPSRDEVQSIAATAWASGITDLDTARAYGTAELAIGGLPQAWRVVTKTAPDVAGDDVTERDAVERTRASLLRSQEALRRDRLDVVLLHRGSHLHQSGGGAWATLRDERERGRIGAIGASAVSVTEAFELIQHPDVAVIQVPASLLDQRLQRAGFFTEAARSGREIFVRSIFLQGLAHLPVSAIPRHLEELRNVLRELDSIAARFGLRRSALFLGWARHRLPGARILVGCETRQQLVDNVAAWDAPGIEQAVADLDGLVPALPAHLLDPWRWPSSAPAG